MASNPFDYDTEGLKTALDAVGVRPGGIVFSHVGMGFLGIPKGGKDLQAMVGVIYRAFRELLGPDGTWLVPTYTYSFCRGEVFDTQLSSSTVGYFTEEFRKMPGVIRSIEPNFSVAGIGSRAEELFRDLPQDSFGPDCIYDRLVRANASICNVGVGFRYATFVHYAEQTVGVPYRMMKTFSGRIVDGTSEYKASIAYYVRTGLDDEATFPDLNRLERDARGSGHFAEAAVGRGIVTHIGCRDLLALCIRGIRDNPWYLARGREKNHVGV